MTAEPRQPSILIVDDTPENLDVLKRTLMDDYRIRPAINGPLALRLAAMAPQPDLILLDIMMPEMDGYEVCRRLKANPDTQDIPVIFVTAKSGHESELEGLKIGAVDFISKPIRPPVVKARVKTHLALRHFNRELEEKNRRLYEINERLNDSMEQLSASEERFRSLVQTIPDIVYKIDAEGRFVFLNKSIERLGYHQSELIGRHFTEIIHSADIPQASLEQVLGRSEPGKPNPQQKVFDERRTGVRMTVGLEIRLKNKSGEEAGVVEIRNIDDHAVNVEVNSTGLYGEVGHDTAYRTRQYVGTVGVIRDITERNKVQKALLEERQLLHRLIDAVPLPIFYMAHEGDLGFANEAFRTFTGVGAEAVEGSCLKSLFGELGEPLMAAMLKELRDNPRKERQERQLRLMSARDGYRVVDVILRPFQRADRPQPAVIGVLVDVTAQIRIHEELIEARRAAEAASRAKGDFLANMSHEIRTPLNAVIGLTHLCLQTELNHQQRDYLGKVSLSANALLNLLNDILDFSKIEAGKMTMEEALFSVDEVLGGIVAIASVKSQEKGLEFLLDTAANVPARLVGDAHRLGQVLTNLVGNAVKFTEAGEVVVRTEVLQQDGESLLLQFSVRDTGIGMTEGQMQGLFQEFSQGDASTTRKYGGSGLGLTISKRLVALMGGEIRVESEAKRGSCFFFTARFKAAADEDASIPQAEGWPQRVRVLVVDDHATARQVLSAHLQSIGCEVVGVDGGEAALSQLADPQTPCELVLLDWQMPGLNGLEVAERIRALPLAGRRPKIVMVTAYGQEQVIASAEQQALLDGFLSKPVSQRALRGAIGALFGHPSAEMRQDRESAQRAALAGLKILLVEDDEINQEVSREQLLQVGIEVTTASNGREAVACVDGGAPLDGVLMDMYMPVMDGLEATRIIRQTRSAQDLPIIAMTASAMEIDRERCLQAGMNDHVAKPVVPRDLYAVLYKWLGGVHSPSPPLPSVVSQPPRPPVAPMPPIPGIDVARALDHMGGDQALYRELLSRFVLSYWEMGQHLLRCHLEGDLEQLAESAHQLQGSAALIGATQLAKLAQQLETQASGPHPHLPELVNRTNGELTAILQAVKTLLPSPRHPQSSPAGNVPQTVDKGQLTAPFRRAARLLEAFDSSVEGVMAELTILAACGARAERLAAMRKALALYDFEKALALLRHWAHEEGIEL